MKKPAPPSSPEPKTLGEHLRKSRLASDFPQWAAAARIGVHPRTYAAWERDENVPLARFRPVIIRFLGYDAFATTRVQPRNRRLRRDPALLTALPGRLRQRRTDLALGRRQVAIGTGVHEDTIRNWERGWTRPAPRHAAGLLRFLGLEPAPSPRSVTRYVYVKDTDSY